MKIQEELDLDKISSLAQEMVKDLENEKWEKIILNEKLQKMHDQLQPKQSKPCKNSWFLPV